MFNIFLIYQSVIVRLANDDYLDGTIVGTMQYLQLRRSTYYFRYTLPKAIASYLEVPREIKRSLKTDSRRTAIALIGSKLRIIETLKMESHTQNKQILLDLYYELTDFKDLAPLSQDERNKEAQGYIGIEDEVRSLLDNRNPANPDEPIAINFELLRNEVAPMFKSFKQDQDHFKGAYFQLLRLLSLRTEYAYNGESDDFYHQQEGILKVLRQEGLLSNLDAIPERGMLMSELFESFLNYKITRKSLSKDYQSKYKRVFNWFLEINTDMEVQLVTRKVLTRTYDLFSALPKRGLVAYKKLSTEEYLAFENKEFPEGDKYSSSTLSQIHKTLQGVFRYAREEEGIIDKSPTDGLDEVLENNTNRREPYSIEEMNEQVLPVAISSDEEWFKWLVLFGAYTGMRRSEIVNLNVNDLHLDCKIPYLTVEKGKTDNATRTIVVHEDLIRYCLKDFVNKANDKGFIFGKEIQMNGSKTNRMLPECKDSNDKKKTFYSLRHTFVDMLSKKAKKEYFVLFQQMVGHSIKKEIGITANYIHNPSPEDLKVLLPYIKYDPITR